MYVEYFKPLSMRWDNCSGNNIHVLMGCRGAQEQSVLWGPSVCSTALDSSTVPTIFGSLREYEVELCEA